MGAIEGQVSLFIALAMLAVKIFAFVSALTFSGDAYEAAGKLTKPAWTIILGLGAVLQLLLIGTILNLVFTVAALVFIVDVRPALSGLRRR